MISPNSPGSSRDLATSRPHFQVDSMLKKLWFKIPAHCTRQRPHPTKEKRFYWRKKKVNIWDMFS